MRNSYIQFILICLLFVGTSFTANAQCDPAASPGTMQTGALFACFGQTAGTNAIGANVPAGYAGVYALHSSATMMAGTIYATNPSSGFFANDGSTGAPLGALSYVSYVIGLDADADGAIDDLSDPCTQVASGAELYLMNEISITYTVTCNADGLYMVEYFINGGEPELLDANGNQLSNQGYDITVTDANGTSTTLNDQLSNGPYIAGPFADLSTTIIIGNDEKNCSGSVTITPTVPCSCTADAGSMPSGLISVCDGGTASAQATGAVGGFMGSVCYALHDSPTGVPGTIYAVNSTGTFSNPGVSGTLYISSVAGPAGANGCPDLSDNCTVVAPGTPVVFLDPITVTCVPSCVDGASDGYTLTCTISGGDGNYTVTGTPADGTVIADGTPWSVSVSDGAGCSGSASGSGLDCGCNNSAGSMPSSTDYVCDGDVASATSVGFILNAANGDVITYALHDGSGAAPGANIYDVSSTGSFTNSISIPNNTLLYISAIVGPDADGDGVPDLGDPCTSVAPGRPAVFLNPISVNSTQSCDNTTGEFTVNYNISGGLPAYDAASTYSVSGDDNQTGLMPLNDYSFGPLADGSTYSIVVTDGANCSQTHTAGPIECQKLPVTLISYTGEASPEGNILKWSTASELYNDFFTLYASTDGQSFREVTTVNGSGTTYSPTSYSYNDKTGLNNSVTYYRLEQTDFDGTTEVIGLVTIEREVETSFNINSLQPIPVVSTLEITFTTIDDITEVNVSVFDVIGRVMNDWNVDAQKGSNTFNVELTDLNSGVYFIAVKQNDNVVTKRFIKE